MGGPVTQEQIQAFAEDLSEEEMLAMAYDWDGVIARPDQILPTWREWTYWLILAGRGWGKTRTGAEAVRAWNKQGFQYINLIGATSSDARDIMIQGESGILSCCPRLERPEYLHSSSRLLWPNGAVSLIFTADEPDRLRGKQHEKLWADEIAAWRYADSWDQANFGLRLGTCPQAIATTTPRPTLLVRDLIADPATFVTRGSTYDNRANLAKTFFSAILRKYEGTRIGRQEIKGEVLDDNPGALFQRKDIEKGRVVRAPANLDRIVVAIDPGATDTEGSNETGIVVAGCAVDKDGIDHGYLLADLTLVASPEGWAKVAVKAYHESLADRIVAEVNQGGDMVEAVIRAVDRNVPVTKVHATRGKAKRAEPVAALYEQGRIHHVGQFPKLEDQVCEWDPLDDSAASPDRMDALVWAFTDLMLGDKNDAYLQFMKAELAEQAALDKAAEKEGRGYL
jgi:phage terminase large subunit-like protein